VTRRPPWAALFAVWGGLVLAAAAPTPGSVARPADGGQAAPASSDGGAQRPGRDGGTPAPLSAEDLEVVQNLDLLEHLPESEVLDLLLLAPDQ
jgi:hypothetical protein